MNKNIFMLLFGLGQKHKFFGKTAKVIAKYSYPFYYAVYTAGFLLTLPLLGKRLFMYIFIPFTVYLINNFIRSRLGRKRPFQELNIKPLLSHKSSPSCPSNHAACAVVIALAFTQTAVYYNNEILIHYPRDIALGYFIGFTGWIIEYNIINRLL